MQGDGQDEFEIPVDHAGHRSRTQLDLRLRGSFLAGDTGSGITGIR